MVLNSIFPNKFVRKDATMREIIDLIKTSIPCAMQRDAKF